MSLAATAALGLVQFAIEQLPKLLEELGAGQELQALQKLAELYQQTRVGTIQDRAPEIAADRAAVDARLAERLHEADDS
jgi:hypothetical protein